MEIVTYKRYYYFSPSYVDFLSWTQENCNWRETMLLMERNFTDSSASNENDVASFSRRRGEPRNVQINVFAAEVTLLIESMTPTNLKVQRRERSSLKRRVIPKQLFCWGYQLHFIGFVEMRRRGKKTLIYFWRVYRLASHDLVRAWDWLSGLPRSEQNFTKAVS